MFRFPKKEATEISVISKTYRETAINETTGNFYERTGAHKTTNRPTDFSSTYHSGTDIER
jgi:hypothetical protein